jgi:hypothetical protein
VGSRGEGTVGEDGGGGGADDCAAGVSSNSLVVRHRAVELARRAGNDSVQVFWWILAVSGRAIWTMNMSLLITARRLHIAMWVVLLFSSPCNN